MAALTALTALAVLSSCTQAPKPAPPSNADTDADSDADTDTDTDADADADTGDGTTFDCRVQLEAVSAGWQLVRSDGLPFRIVGAGGTEHMAEAAHAGANTIRTWGLSDDTASVLDAAQEHGLCVVVGLWMSHASSGFDYTDSAAVAEQHDALLAQVASLVAHPAVLLWGIGNESEVGNDTPAYWAALDALAAGLAELDPTRPRMTVTAELGDNYGRRLADAAPHIQI